MDTGMVSSLASLPSLTSLPPLPSIPSLSSVCRLSSATFDRVSEHLRVVVVLQQHVDHYGERLVHYFYTHFELVLQYTNAQSVCVFALKPEHAEFRSRENKVMQLISEDVVSRKYISGVYYCTVAKTIAQPPPPPKRKYLPRHPPKQSHKQQYSQHLWKNRLLNK